MIQSLGDKPVLQIKVDYLLLFTLSHKFNDFWDNLVVDIDHIVKKAAGEDVDDTEEKRMELFDVYDDRYRDNSRIISNYQILSTALKSII